MKSWILTFALAAMIASPGLGEIIVGGGNATLQFTAADAAIDDWVSYLSEHETRQGNIGVGFMFVVLKDGSTVTDNGDGTKTWGVTIATSSGAGFISYWSTATGWVDADEDTFDDTSGLTARQHVDLELREWVKQGVLTYRRWQRDATPLVDPGLPD